MIMRFDKFCTPENGSCEQVWYEGRVLISFSLLATVLAQGSHLTLIGRRNSGSR